MRHKGIYLLPNLFTTANLFAGFYSIICAVNGDFNIAAATIYVAMLLDGLDGRVARMTNTQSAFGSEYDSLSDMVAFGVAPAILAYQWMLIELGNVGLTISFIYVACAALRLARFNTQINVVDKGWFVGLASPAAAGVIAGIVWSIHTNASNDSAAEVELSFAMTLLFAVLVALSSLLMVSNIKYNSFKNLDLKGRVPFVAILVMALAFAVVLSDPPTILLLIFLVYAISGIVQYVWGFRDKQQAVMTPTY